ncbi:hypothetical protein EDF46_3299 [Frondihabitans sp. PhB188]|nr:hypothetical protein EDF46_3299 [Frondihabitans sp. PhB188]
MYSEMTRPVGAARTAREKCRESVADVRSGSPDASRAFVRPLPALGRTALVSGAFSLLPVFAAILWLTHGSWLQPVAVFAEVVVTAVFFVVYIRFRLVFTSVTATHFVKQRMVLPTTAVDLSLIDRVLVNRVYRGGSTEALTQMLAVDAMGRRLFAMNALFWSDADITTISDALDGQTTVDLSPMSRREYFREFPMARGWYLSRAAMITYVVSACVVITAAVVALRAAFGD